MSARVAGVLLAAGAGRRFGQPKALVRLGDRLLVERGIEVLRLGGCEPVVVVLGAAASEVEACADLSSARVVVNARWTSGMASSLVAGLAALPDEVGAAVVALVDQPLVGSAAVERLAAAWRAGARVAVAGYDARPRNPVLFDRAVWPEVAASASGDVGARAFLRAHPGMVTVVDCTDTGSPVDVDTPEDLALVAGRLTRKEA